MIDPKELRVGNIVDYFSDNLDWWFNRLAISENDLCCLLSGDNQDHADTVKLTEEWLIKFDYLAEVGTYRFSIAGKFPALFIDTENKKCWLEANTDMILLDYPGTVHRFQNLHYAIYNEELTIKE